jgi:hypothetical protein
MAQVTDRQRRAIEVLLAAKSTSEAAEASGIPRRTLERWKRDPDFQDAYRAASRERLSETVGRLRTAASEAVTALQAALQDEHTGNCYSACNFDPQTGVIGVEN